MADKELPDIIPLSGPKPVTDDLEAVFDPDSGQTVYRSRKTRVVQDPNASRVTGYFDALGDQFIRSWQTETKDDLKGDIGGILSKLRQIESMKPLSPEEEFELSQLSAKPLTPFIPSGPYLDMNSPSFRAQARIGELRSRQNREGMLKQLEVDLGTKIQELNETVRILSEHQGTTEGKLAFDRANGFLSSLKALVKNPIEATSGLVAENSVTSAKAAGAGLALTAATAATGGGALLATGAGLVGGAAVGGKDTYDSELAAAILNDPAFEKDPAAYIAASRKQDPIKAEQDFQAARNNAIGAGLIETGTTIAAGGLTKLLPAGTTPIRKFLWDQLGEQIEEQVVGDAGSLFKTGKLMSAKERLSTGVSTLGQGVATSAGEAGLSKAADASGLSRVVSEALRKPLQVDTSTLRPLGMQGQAPGQMVADLNTLTPLTPAAPQAQPQADPSATPQLRVNPATLTPADAGLPDVIPLSGPTGKQAPQAEAGSLPDVIPLSGPTAQAPQAPQAKAQATPAPQAQAPAGVSSAFNPTQTAPQAEPLPRRPRRHPRPSRPATTSYLARSCALRARASCSSTWTPSSSMTSTSACLPVRPSVTRRTSSPAVA